MKQKIMPANRQGLTIIETLVYVAIFTLAIGVVSGLLIYFYRTNAYTIQQGYAVESARKGIEIMVREIKEATYSDSGAYPLIEADEQILSFYSDIDKDDNVEMVRYYLNGSDFERGETEAVGDPPIYEMENEVVSVISDNVRNGVHPIFAYYNASSTEIVDLEILTDIKLVRASLIVNIDPNRSPEEFTLISSAQLRNLYEY